MGVQNHRIVEINRVIFGRRTILDEREANEPVGGDFGIAAASSSADASVGRPLSTVNVVTCTRDSDPSSDIGFSHYPT